MKLIFVRHGETVENTEGVIMGQTHGTLTTEGKKQVERLARALAEKKIDVAYSSDLGRCRETVKIIMTSLPNLVVRFTDQIREKHAGVFQGKKHKEIDWALEGDFLTRQPPEGESYADLEERVRVFLDELKNKHENHTVLIISHGGVMKMSYAVLTKSDIKTIFETMKLGHANICEMDVTDDGASVLCWEEAPYLGSS